MILVEGKRSWIVAHRRQSQTSASVRVKRKPNSETETLSVRNVSLSLPHPKQHYIIVKQVNVQCGIFWSCVAVRGDDGDVKRQDAKRERQRDDGVFAVLQRL